MLNNARCQSGNLLSMRWTRAGRGSDFIYKWESLPEILAVNREGRAFLQSIRKDEKRNPQRMRRLLVSYKPLHIHSQRGNRMLKRDGCCRWRRKKKIGSALHQWCAFMVKSGVQVAIKSYLINYLVLLNKQ